MSNFITNNQSIKIFFVGLGNPGSEYSKTRHNAGYMFIDKLIEEWQAIEKGSQKGLYQSFEGSIGDRKVSLIKPLTYMNLSGKAVQHICSFFKCRSSQIIVVYDDIALPLGTIRIRKQGSAGGHNGIKSIIEVIGQDFPRIRIGIGDDRNGKDLSSHVLSKFSIEEKVELEKVLAQCPAIAKSIAEDGLELTMSKYSK